MASVKIGGFRFKIKEEDNVYSGDMKLDGDINYPELVIRLERSNPQIIKDLVLLHEIMHGVFTLSINREMGGDEAFIMQVADRLYALIRDNPKMFVDIAQRKVS